MADEYEPFDYLSQRGSTLVSMAVHLENVTNEDSRSLCLEYMAKLVDSIGIDAPAAQLKVVPFKKGE